MLAYELLKALWPLLYQAVAGAIGQDSCPLQAAKAVMDSEEAQAILAEWKKFKGK